MTDIQRQKIKEKILEDLNSLSSEIRELEVICQPISPECALGDLARFELMNDQVVSEKALKESRSRENRLKYTLSKINDETFGLCEVCEEEISIQRLLILPESTLCIECASAYSF